jgi:hypothetical protein
LHREAGQYDEYGHEAVAAVLHAGAPPVHRVTEAHACRLARSVPQAAEAGPLVEGIAGILLDA